MTKSKFFFPLAVALMVALTGCVAPPLTGTQYSRTEARNVMDVRLGTIESVRVVKLDGSRSMVGAVAGGALGGVAGSTMGKGKGKTAMTILGALLGAGAGAAIEEGATATVGLELMVRLDSGRLIAVVQEASQEQLTAGQRVRVLTNAGISRVTRL